MQMSQDHGGLCHLFMIYMIECSFELYEAYHADRYFRYNVLSYQDIIHKAYYIAYMIQYI